MKFKVVFCLSVIYFGLLSPLSAQKIGYANIEVILALMPESKSMQQTLQVYEKSLGEKIQMKQQFYQQRAQEYLELQRTTQDEARLKPLEDELLNLEEQIRKESADAQIQLVKKRQDLLEPILQKLQQQIDALSESEGYSYILNTVDGSGVSIVLHGPKEHDLTEKLMTRLGIQIPGN